MNNKNLAKGPAEPGVKEASVDKRRRSLLTAGVAAPAVLTLNPVSASAGSIMECVANQQEQPRNTFSKWRDKWARKEVSAFWVHRDSGLKGDQRAAAIDSTSDKAGRFERSVPNKGGAFVGTDPDDAYLLVEFKAHANDMDGNEWAKGFGDSFISPAGETYKRTWVEEKRYAAIYVTEDGKVIGIEPEHARIGTAVMESCWSSVAEAAAKQVW